MPRYHFHVTDGHSVAVDAEGSELGGNDAARDEALASARHLTAQSDERGMCRRHWRMNVEAGNGEVVFSLPFAHALEADQLAHSDTRQRA